MGTVRDRINDWRLSELRGASQVNMDVCVAWYNKALNIFQKELLEYVANQFHVQTVYSKVEAWKNEYDFPVASWNIKDFYSITQLRIAYKTDKDWNPVYRVVKPISLTDYNIDSKGKQHWKPIIWSKITCRSPKYVMAWANKYKIFPVPTETINNWIVLDFNYFLPKVSENTNESTLDLPRYFLDVIDDYLSFRLFQAENPELAGSYYQQFKETLHNNIYGLNRDQRPVEEEFWNFTYFDHR